MDYTRISRRGLLAGAAALPVFGSRTLAQETPPNILFILADDLGYADLSCYGQRDFTTPRLDRLAAEGVRLLQGYANSAVCSATRFALITGRYQYRLRAGLDEPISSQRPDLGLDPALPTMPSLLKKMGYRTSLIGKWHLGEPPNFSPRKSGYDYFYGIYAGGADYFNHTLYENDKVVKDQGYLTDLLGDRAVEEIETSAKTGKPFFMSLHFTAPHWPWEGPDDKQANAKKPPSSGHWNGGDLETYGEMVRSLDDNAGKALDAIERRGLADNTIVVFTSDNGGERFSDTWPFVGVKTELLEGGLRVPLMVKWPGRISAGTTSGQVMTSMDFLPTLLAAAGSAPDPAYPSDGENLMDILLGDTTPRPRKLYWRYKALEQIALRDHDWKYLKIADREFLFNLAEDQRERVNLKESEPALFRQLKADFDMWNAGMLPYTLTSAEYTLSDHLADRY